MDADERKPDAQVVEMWETVVSSDAAAHDGAVDQTIAPSMPVETFTRRQLLGELPRIDPNEEHSEFDVKRTLGEGSMGLVRLARQASLYRDVAIKTVHPEQIAEKSTLDLLQESWVTGMLEHPNIVPVHTLGVDEHGAPMMVMKRVEGVSWHEAVDNHYALPPAFRGGRDRLDNHIDILIQVCNAVEFAHSKGIIHCDLKPTNVMLGAFGEVYLVDWGIAVALEDDGTGRLPLAEDVTSLSGSPGYISPELAAGQGDRIDRRTDVYLLGAILHRLVTGAYRHKGDSVRELLRAAYRSSPVDYDDSVPDELAEICNRATHADRDRRFDDVEAFRSALVDFKQHRESLRLSAQADVRLRRLEKLVSRAVKDRQHAYRGSLDDETITEVNRLYNECRFGFDQALQVWEDNEDARRGATRATEVMLEFELFQRNDKAAAVLMDELPAVPDELRSRLAGLRRELAQEAEEIERNRQISRDVDIDLASRQRSRMFVLFGFIFGAMPILNQLAIDQGWASLTFQDYAIQYALVVTGAALVVIPMRDKLFENSINSRFITSVFATIGGLGLVRIAGYLLGLDPGGCIALENVLLAFSVGMMAVAFDRRLWATPIPFVVGALVGSWKPELILYADGISNALALWLFAFAWRGGQEE